MSNKEKLRLVAHNPDLRRTPPVEWEGAFIKGGRYGLPEKPLDLINPTPFNRRLTADFNPHGYGLDDFSYDDLAPFPHLTETHDCPDFDPRQENFGFMPERKASAIREMSYFLIQVDFKCE